MGWRILLQDDEGPQFTSSSLATREAALSYACDVMRAGDLQIIEIVDAAGDKIDLDEVALFPEAAKLARAGRARVCAR